jgi:hypothetical protein
LEDARHRYTHARHASCSTQTIYLRWRLKRLELAPLHGVL